MDALTALGRRTDLAQYESNRLMLFALELALSIEDVHAVAASSLTDGADDKKCDLIYVDRGLGLAVVAQGYMAVDASRPAAPANKASDLNTAIGWLLGAPLGELPQDLRPAASELRSALDDKAIGTLEIWYCHNLPESVNVQNELDTVERTAHSLLDSNYPESEVAVVRSVEVGRTRLEAFFRSTHVPIVVTDELEVRIPGGFAEHGDGWEAFCTSIPAAWLRDLFLQKGTDLFSANVRGYLGSIRSERNINHNIKTTVREQPSRFWAYNNGLTALVDDYALAGRGKHRRLRLMGISIVNGAQTTGALGAITGEDASSLGDARVLARFVKCTDRDVISQIIRYNNSQNVVEPFDFRSGDLVQKRLVREFSSIPEADYRGFRRGGERDQIERPANLIPSSTAAQALVAFHADPTTAYNEKSKISEDSVYPIYFNEMTTARHLLFSYSLYRAVEETKRGVTAVAVESRTNMQKAQATFFAKRGSLFLLTYAVAASLETVIGTRIPDPFKLSFSRNASPRDAITSWMPVVTAVLPFVAQLEPALEGNLKNRDRIGPAVDTFAALVEATKQGNPGPFTRFSSEVQYR